MGGGVRAAAGPDVGVGGCSGTLPEAVGVRVCSPCPADAMRRENAFQTGF